MKYFDTDILVNASIIQDENKHQESIRLTELDIVIL